MGLAKCGNHPKEEAKWACGACGKNLCPRCVTLDIEKGRPIRKCQACGGPVTQAADESARFLPKAFLSELPKIAAYPFQGNGGYMLLTTAIIFGLLDVMKTYWSITAIIAFVIGSLYGICIYAYMVDIVRSSAAGDTEPPPWPERIAYNSFLVVCTLTVCLGPAAVLGIWWLTSSEAFKWITSRPAWLSEWLVCGVALAGLTCLPMAFLSVSLEDSLRGLNPLRVIPSIVRVFPAYAIALILLFGTVFGYFYWSYAMNEYLPHVPLLSGAVGAGVGLYLQLVLMRIVGLMYHAQETRLGWY